MTRSFKVCSTAAIVLTVVGIYGCESQPRKDVVGSGRAAPEPFLTPSEARDIEAVTFAEAFRVDPEVVDAEQKNKSQRYIDNRRIITGPVKMSAMWLKGLKSAFRKLQKYSIEKEIHDPKPCEPTPGVIYRLKTSWGFIDITLCYECAEFWSNGFTGANFDHIEREMIVLAMKAFPNDKIIQSL